MSLPNLDAGSNGVPNDSLQFLANGLPAAWIADDPDAAATSPEAVYQAALKYVDAGLSVIPIDAEDASKSPDPRRIRSWKDYQVRLPRPDELRAWYECGGLFGLAVVGGGVSGGQRACGLEIIDFDSFDLAIPWVEQVESRASGLTMKLVMVESPRPGVHIYFRCPSFGGCQKLACMAVEDANGVVLRDEAGRATKTTLIELKAEGGYCLVPPSPRRCHPRNQLYRILEGSPDLTQVPVISVEERTILLDAARSFNKWTEAEPTQTRPVTRTVRTDGNRPGDDYDRRASWADILVPHGWTLVRRRGEIEDWRRPGKGEGISATVNYAASGLLFVFSTNGHPFEDGRGYSKFAAYAVLNHGGEYGKAARALQGEGYGTQQLPAGNRSVMGGVRTVAMRTGNGTRITEGQ